jgi:glucokinase
MADRYYVGIDVGGTSMRVAVASASGEILAHAKAPTQAEAGPVEVFRRLAVLVDHARSSVGASQGPAAAWGVAFPGPIDHQTWVLTTPPNLRGWHNVPVRDLLAPLAGTTVMIGNDAQLAALGEHAVGAGKGVSELVYMTISTGIGGGLISKNRLLLGTDGSAGEVGHMVIDRRGPLCNCGNYGCLEALASGTAIGRTASQRLARGESSVLAALPQPVAAKDVIDAARKNDTLAREVLQEAAEILGAGCVSVVNLLNPQVIVLGGGVSLHAGKLLLAPVRRMVAARALELPRKAVRVELAELGDDAGLYGAIALARQGATLR